MVQEGLNVIESGRSKLLEFGIPNEAAWELGLACGGTIKIFVAPITDGSA